LMKGRISEGGYQRSEEGKTVEYLLDKPKMSQRQI
jgi:hypothetical protein